MNIKDLEKLRELKDKGALTQEEFDEQVANYLNSAKASKEKNENISSDKHSTHGGIKISHIIYLGLAFIAIYIAVEGTFPNLISCNKNLSQGQCNCVKHAISKNTSFLNKVKMLIIGASHDELDSYLDLSSRFLCIRELII